MEWILEIALIYQIKDVTKYEPHYVYGFKTEEACLIHRGIEDKHLKRIKSQTNIKSFELNCYERKALN